MGDQALSTDEQSLARATKLAVQSAGGLEMAKRETGLSIAHLSRFCSGHERDSISVRDVVAIEALGHGRDGHPHVTRALARIAGGVFILLPEGADDADGLQGSVIDLAAELGDVSQGVRDALSSSGPGGAKVLPQEAAAVLDELHALDAVSAKLRRQLEKIAKGEPARE